MYLYYWMPLVPPTVPLAPVMWWWKWHKVLKWFPHRHGHPCKHRQCGGVRCAVSSLIPNLQGFWYPVMAVYSVLKWFPHRHEHAYTHSPETNLYSIQYILAILVKYSCWHDFTHILISWNPSIHPSRTNKLSTVLYILLLLNYRHNYHRLLKEVNGKMDSVCVCICHCVCV